MAAETLTSTRAAASFPVAAGGPAGMLMVATGQYEIAANVEAGDIFELCKVPANAVVVGGWLYGDDLDTNATETIDLDIGWKANDDEVTDTDGFGNFGVVTGDAIAGLKPVAGIMLPLQGVLLANGPKKFTAETTLQVIFNAAGATGGTGTISLVVYYFVDENYA